MSKNKCCVCNKRLYARDVDKNVWTFARHTTEDSSSDFPAKVCIGFCEYYESRLTRLIVVPNNWREVIA